MRGLIHFAHESLGIDLYPGQQTVLNEWAESAKRKAVLALGRRSGKGLMAAVAAIFNAVVPDYAPFLRPGEQRFILVVAVRLEQAREFIRTVREILAAAPDLDLAEMVDTTASTLDEVKFANGVTIRAMPCSSRSSRGLAASLVIMDEAAHMQTTEAGFAAGKLVYDALVPSTAQFGEMGYVMLTSSPLWSTGMFWDRFQAGLTGVAEDIFVVQRPTWEMNPTVTRESLEYEFRSDPDSARVEYGAEFAEGAGAYLNAVAIHECVVKGRTELPPVDGINYVGAADPAFAAGGDAFTFAIAHRVGSGDKATYVLDLLRSWRGKESPLNSDAVLDEIASLARSFRLEEVISDQYAIHPLSDAMRRRNVPMRGQILNNELKADLYGSLKKTINLGQIELLDHDQLISELTFLEIRPTPSGKPRIAAAGGKHDDHPMALATVVHELAAGGKNGRFYGSVAASADDWVALLADEAKKAEGERPRITTAVVHHLR